jgi:hypothetical protein
MSRQQASNFKPLTLLTDWMDKSESRYWTGVLVLYSPAIAAYGLALWAGWRFFR